MAESREHKPPPSQDSGTTDRSTARSLPHPPRLLVAVPLVAVGGAAGAVLRWAAGSWTSTGDDLALVTFGVNVLGCLVLGLLPGLDAVRRWAWAPVLLGPGLIGGFTTLSTWSDETRALAMDGRTALAGLYALGTLAACLVAASLGRAIAERQRPAGTTLFDAEDGDR